MLERKSNLPSQNWRLVHCPSKEDNHEHVYRILLHLWPRTIRVPCPELVSNSDTNHRQPESLRAEANPDGWGIVTLKELTILIRQPWATFTKVIHSDWFFHQEYSTTRIPMSMSLSRMKQAEKRFCQSGGAIMFNLLCQTKIIIKDDHYRWLPIQSFGTWAKCNYEPGAT